MQLDDPLDHLLEDGQGLVAGRLDEQAMELLLEDDDTRRVALGRLALVEVRQQRLQHRVGPPVLQRPERGELDRFPRRVDVGEGGSPELEHQAGIAGGDVTVGGVDARPAPRPAPNADQRLRFEDPERLPQGRS